MMIDAKKKLVIGQNNNTLAGDFNKFVKCHINCIFGGKNEAPRGGFDKKLTSDKFPINGTQKDYNTQNYDLGNNMIYIS